MVARRHVVVLASVVLLSIALLSRRSDETTALLSSSMRAPLSLSLSWLSLSSSSTPATLSSSSTPATSSLSLSLSLSSSSSSSVSPAPPSSSLPAGVPRVPFYMYDSEPFRALARRCIDNHTAVPRRHAAHAAAAAFVRAARTHAWRVAEPERAALFVVPVMFFGGQYACDGFGALVRDVAAALRASPWWQRARGRDHVLVDTNWRLHEWISAYGVGDVFERHMIRGVSYLWKGVGYSRAAAVTARERSALRRSRNTDYCQIVVPKTTGYSSQLGAHGGHGLRALDDAAARPYRFFFIGQADARPEYRTRMALLRERAIAADAANVVVVTKSVTTRDALRLADCTASPDALFAAGFNESDANAYYEHARTASANHTRLPGTLSGPCYLDPPSTALYTHALASSRYDVCVRGDDYSSKRIFDAVQLGTVNVFLSDLIYETALPFQCWVPWREFSLAVDEREFLRRGRRALDAAVATLDRSASARRRVADAMHRHRGDVVWEVDDSRVTSLVLAQALRKCVVHNERFDGDNTSAGAVERRRRRHDVLATLSTDARALVDAPCPHKDVELPFLQHSVAKTPA